MEEAQFYYYSTLAKYSITNNFFIFIFLIMEITPILLDCIFNPFLIQFYYKKYEISYSSSVIELKPIHDLKKITIYYWFRKLRDSNNLYPISVLIPTLGVIFSYFIFFILFGWYENMSKNNPSIKNNKKKDYKILKSFKIIFVNLYDHLFFRGCSILIYDVVICYLCNSSNYFVLIVTIIILLFTLYLNYEYFNTFRLNIKYDLNYKYVYDGKFMLYVDYFCLILKINLCFKYNVEDNKISFFFNILSIIMIILICVKFIQINCFNFISYSKGMLFILCFFLIFFNLIFNDVKKKNYTFYCYLLISCIISLIITLFLRKMKFAKVIHAPINSDNNQFTQEKFELLCEYYKKNKFNELLYKICYANKIRIENIEENQIENEKEQKENLNEEINVDETEKLKINKKNEENDKNLNFNKKNSNKKETKENNILLHKFLKTVSKQFKIDSECHFLDKDTNLFYYSLCKVYLELMTTCQNDFSLLFETRKILLKLKKSNLILYYDLRFFYELLCDLHSMQNNSNFYQYNDSYYKIYDNLNKMSKSFIFFLAKKSFNKPKDYINISNEFAKFEKIVKNKYEYLSTNSFKDEYQKLLLKIIIEGMLNKSLTIGHNNLLIYEEFRIYEEIFEKQYLIDKQLKIKFNLKDNKTEIIKIGHELNSLWGKSIENLFPIQFLSIAKNEFFNLDNINMENINNKENLNGQMYKFILWDEKGNLKQFLFLYKIYPNFKEEIAYIDGVYQIGKDPLLVTECDKFNIYNEEKILCVSKELENFLLIEQDFIHLLKKYDNNIIINNFIDGTEIYSYNLKKYVHYLKKIIKILLSICSREDLPLLNNISDKLNSIQKKNEKNSFFFNYKFSIFPNNSNNETNTKEFRIYTIKQTKSKNKLLNYKNSVTEWNFEDSISETENSKNNNLKQVNSIIVAYDTASINSITSLTSQFSGYNALNNKKNSHIEYRNNSQIIVLFNFLVIIIAFFCLFYENSLNDQLLSKSVLYKVVYNFNTLILNTIVVFYSMICFSSDGSTCTQGIKNIIDNSNYSQIFELNRIELIEKINDLIIQFNNLKTKVENSGINDIKKYSSTLKNEIHLTYENRSLYLTVTKEYSFDFLMGEFINKLIIITNSSAFESSFIYPLQVDENFVPTNLKIPENVTSLSTIQIYTYEIILTYLEYCNHLYALQLTMEQKVNDQISFNRLTLTIFIIALILSNLIVMIICYTFFLNFQKVVNKKLFLMKKCMKDENNLNILNDKINLILILFKFYNKKPMEILEKLNEKTKIKKEHHNPNNNNNNNNNINGENNENNENQSKVYKKYDTYFMQKPFTLFLISMIIFYLIYSIAFIIVSTNSFINLSNICTVIEVSAYSSIQYFFGFGVVELYQYIKVPQEGFYKTVWAVFDNSTLTENPNVYTEYINILQNTMLNEKSLKESKSSIGSDKDAISMNCEDFFIIIDDPLFTKINNTYSNLNYFELLKTYCYSVKSLESGNVDLFLDECTYQLMQMLFINYKNEDFVTVYDNEELTDLFLKSSFLYRPLIDYLDKRSFKFLDDGSDTHFQILLYFLLGNIILEILYFILIKIKIIDKIKIINTNLDKLIKILKCV